MTPTKLVFVSDQRKPGRHPICCNEKDQSIHIFRLPAAPSRARPVRCFYQERKVMPQRFDNESRYLLVLLSRCFTWTNALVNVTPKTLIGWHRAGFRLVLALEMPGGTTEDPG